MNGFSQITLCEKCPVREFFLVPRNFGPNTGKCGLEETPYLDTFHVVQPPSQMFGRVLNAPLYKPVKSRKYVAKQSKYL